MTIKLAINTGKQRVLSKRGKSSLASAMLQAKIAEVLASPEAQAKAKAALDELKASGRVSVLHLSAASQTQFAEALLNPPEPNDALKQAAQRHVAMLVDADTGVTKLG